VSVLHHPSKRLALIYFCGYHGAFPRSLCCKPHANKQEQNRPEKNAAPKGRIKSEWIAELFLQMLMIIISSSTAAGLIVALCWLEPASPVLPGSKPAPCSVQLIQPQYPRH